MADDTLTVLREERDERRVQEWSLVLSSASIPHRLERTPSGNALVVRQRDAALAERSLTAYDEEERQPRRIVRAPALEYGRTVAALATAAGLVAFHAFTGERGNGSVWFERGAASAAHILAGEWWRVVTALTLHADMAHVAANAVFLAVFGTALFGAIGPGLGFWLLLAAGAGGNWLNALLRASAHSAVGASTAIFGGLGALGALQLVRRRRRESGWRTWAPLAAALALLAWLGASPESDVVAHLLGFGVGAALGAAVALADRPPPESVQMVLEIGAAAVVVGCWSVALWARGPVSP